MASDVIYHDFERYRSLFDILLKESHHALIEYEKVKTNGDS